MIIRWKQNEQTLRLREILSLQIKNKGILSSNIGATEMFYSVKTQKDGKPSRAIGQYGRAYCCICNIISDSRFRNDMQISVFLKLLKIKFTHILGSSPSMVWRPGLKALRSRDELSRTSNLLTTMSCRTTKNVKITVFNVVASAIQYLCSDL